jgi:hypothetical protein
MITKKVKIPAVKEEQTLILINLSYAGQFTSQRDW